MRRRFVIALIWVTTITLCVGVLMEFASRARDNANQVRCRQNLHQIGLALHNYHDAHGALPFATVRNPDLTPERRLSWMFEIDPYLHARMDPTWMRHSHEAWDSEGNLSLQRGRNYWFECWQAPVSTRPDGLGLTSYVGVAGVGNDAASLPKSNERAGVFSYERRISFGDIKDGLRQTIFVIETARDIGPWVAGGSPTVRGLDLANAPFIGRDRQFGGRHRGKVAVLFGDGSVQLIRDLVSPESLRSLFTIAAGDEPGLFQE